MCCVFISLCFREVRLSENEICLREAKRKAKGSLSSLTTSYVLLSDAAASLFRIRATDMLFIQQNMKDAAAAMNAARDLLERAIADGSVEFDDVGREKFLRELDRG